MKKLFILCISAAIAFITYAQTTIDSTDVEKVVEDPVYVVVDKAPDFPGGHTALAQFIGENLQYPSKAEINGEQGRSIVQFVVNTDGTISQEGIVRSSGYELLDAEALRVTKAAPQWTPAQIAGKNVRSYYTLPITFKLDTTIYGMAEVDTYAKFLGGQEAINQHLKSVIKLSDLDTGLIQERGESASVLFVVNIDGSISNERITRSTNSKLLDAEALRAIRSLPKWIPAQKEGKNVRSYQTLAIGFNWEHLVKSDSIESNTSDTTVFVVVDKMPEFPGGQQALFNYLSNNVKYPKDAQEQGIEGRVICQYIVEKDGSIGNITVVRTSGNESLDNEAVRVIQSMPNWKPGLQRGKPVRVKYTIPINFHFWERAKSQSSFNLVEIIMNLEKKNLNSTYKEVVEHIQNRINYPSYALQKRIQGTTICSFKVNTDGSIFDINIDLSSGDGILDKEVIHRIKSIPSKKSYQLRSESGEISYSLVVRFIIESTNYSTNEVFVNFGIDLFYTDELQKAITMFKEMLPNKK